MLLVVGLGNPGPRYACNRHNIGFMALDAIARRHGFGRWRTRFHGQLAEGRIGDERVLALKPETFMNESGRAVGAALRFYKLSPGELIVLHDEIDLRPAKVRVKTGGGPGGHNGLRSLDRHIGQDYRRLRLGIGHPGHKDRVEGYVLADFTTAERAWLDPLLDAVAGEFPRLVAGDEGAFMSRVAHLVGPTSTQPPGAAPAAPSAPAATDDGDGF